MSPDPKSGPKPPGAPAAKPAKRASPPISNKLAATPINHYMTRKVVYANPSTTVKVAMQMMITHKISGLVVVDDSNSCLGIYSEVDAMLQGASQPLDAPIKFTKPPLTVYPDTPFRDALVLMAQKKIKRLAVVDTKKKLVGIVSRHDMMKAIFDDVKAQEDASSP